MIIREHRLCLAEEGFFLGDSPKKVEKVLGEYCHCVANWDEVILTNEFRFCGYRFYSRLLFNEMGLYAFMLEPLFRADDTELKRIQQLVDDEVRKHNEKVKDYEMTAEFFNRLGGDFCFTLMKKHQDWANL